MSYKLILRQEAERDLVEAYKWYEEKVPGLGTDFMAVIERSLESIQENPARFPVMYHNVHRALMRRLPYGIFFLGERKHHCAGCPALTSRVVQQQSKETHEIRTTYNKR